MWPLDDITIYYDGSKLKDNPNDGSFSKVTNFISDFYHNSLNGYKPPKTGRICIQITDDADKREPNYFGAICTVYTSIDEDLYLKLEKMDQYSYILDLIHEVIKNSAKKLGWELHAFEAAYQHVLNSEFHFYKPYQPKKSKDRKKVGHAILEKNEERAKIKVKIESSEMVEEVTLIEKRNWYWYDSSYKIVKACKWIDNSTYGYQSRNSDKYAYYSLKTKKVETNMNFDDSFSHGN